MENTVKSDYIGRASFTSHDALYTILKLSSDETREGVSGSRSWVHCCTLLNAAHSQGLLRPCYPRSQLLREGLKNNICIPQRSRISPMVFKDSDCCSGFGYPAVKSDALPTE